MTFDQDVIKKEPSDILNCASENPQHLSLSLKRKIEGETLSEGRMSGPLHFRRCVLRAEHSETFLDHLVEFRIDWHSRVGTAS